MRELAATLEVEDPIARKQLLRVLGSSGFARNERLSKFLQFVVERHLEGKDEELKESVIAVEIFGRPPDYNPKKDAIVRIEAGRLRARLAEYYADEGRSDKLVIELPKGGYVPQFRRAQPLPEANAPVNPRPRRLPWLMVAVSLTVIGLGAVSWRYFQYQTAPIPIAVLPLTNQNQDPTSDYFADGLTSEIIRNLSIIDGLATRSETSTFALKGKSLKASDAGEQLGADYLVEGSVLRSGEQVRINVQLVRVRDDFPVWSEKYEREMKDIFSIQEEISRGIVNNLRLKLGRGRRKYETSTEAYDLYLQARALSLRFEVPTRRKVVPVFEQAIAVDPSFAPAYAGLAEEHALLSGNTNFVPDRADRTALVFGWRAPGRAGEVPPPCPPPSSSSMTRRTSS